MFMDVWDFKNASTVATAFFSAWKMHISFWGPGLFSGANMIVSGSVNPPQDVSHLRMGNRVQRRNKFEQQIPHCFRFFGGTEIPKSYHTCLKEF